MTKDSVEIRDSLSFSGIRMTSCGVNFDLPVRNVSLARSRYSVSGGHSEAGGSFPAPRLLFVI